MSNYLLAAVLFIPLVGAVLTMLVPRVEADILRGLGLATAIAAFLVSLLLVAGFDNSQGGYQFVLTKDWIPALGARFRLGIDGISLWLVLLTTFLTPIVLLSAWSSITKKVKEFI